MVNGNDQPAAVAETTTVPDSQPEAQTEPKPIVPPAGLAAAAAAATTAPNRAQVSRC